MWDAPTYVLERIGADICHEIKAEISEKKQLLNDQTTEERKTFLQRSKDKQVFFVDDSSMHQPNPKRFIYLYIFRGIEVVYLILTKFSLDFQICSSQKIICSKEKIVYFTSEIVGKEQLQECVELHLIQ